ncbi:MAG: polysaccharide pyruvyl transferase family protein [Pseudosphingobacterium sp.]|nr:polysaccharide pyruvyl transferase family protein [Olivibacter sp. UJ_SKK_5.1]MDX3912688.1 polysaccharide pyruvyl transferase family protein [Pseudosphingobacterium sp.]
MKKVIKTYYADLPNMGDLLNELLIRDLFGQDLERHKPATSELSCIGSGMDCFMKKNKVYPRWYSTALKIRANWVNYPNNVWCTGFIFSESAECPDNSFIRDMNICSVRGEMTKGRVEKILGRKLNVPTGDGGIITPYLFDKPIEKKYQVGVVAHMHEQDHPTFQRVLNFHKGSKFINLRDDPYQVIREIASCEVIISSSLHGLIVADSFNVPSQWIIVTDALKGDGFKFADYYSAFGLKPNPIPMPDESVPVPTVNQVIDQFKITPEAMAAKQKEIYDAFPFKNVSV